MSDDVFTQHVLELNRGTDPTSEEFQPVLDAISSFLRHELKRRGIYRRPASYLGYDPMRDWQDPEMLMEAAYDCYCYAILDRLPNLKFRANNGENIDGQIRRNTRYFVSELQRKNDRIGYRVFQNLKAVLKDAVASDILFSQGEPDEFNSETEFCQTGHSATSVAKDVLEECLSSDADLCERENIKILITESGAAQEILSSCLGRLLAAGINSFRIRDLKDSLIKIIEEAGLKPKFDDNASGFFSDDDHDSADLFAVIRGKISQESRTDSANARYEEVEEFEIKVRAVHNAIDDLPNRTATKERLHTVLDSVASSWKAMKAGETGSPTESIDRKQLMNNLEISRSTISEDLQTLNQLWSNIELEEEP